MLPVVAILLLTACSHYNYFPNLVATPFSVKKRESSLSANAGGMPQGNSYNVQAAYNPWNKITLTSNYLNVNNRFFPDADRTNVNITKSHYLEGAAGAWYVLEEEPIYAGCFLGGGSGKIYNEYGSPDEISKLRYNKYFLQPTIIYSSSIFRCGIAARLSHLTYYNGVANTGIPSVEMTAIRKIEQNSPFLLIEGGVNAGIHVRGISFMVNIVQVGELSIKGQGSLSGDYLFNVENYGLGLLVDFHAFFYKKKRTKPSEPTQ